MTRQLKRTIGIASFIAAGLTGTERLTAAADPAKSAAGFFDKRVEPVLRRRCLGCHNEELKNGNISFLDRDSLLRGGNRGPAVVPGNPEASILILSLTHKGELRMPPGEKLPAKQVTILTEWVRRGAAWGTKLRRK